MAPTAIFFYDVVLFVHVAAVVVAFGATFAYPFFQAIVERTSPRSVPAMWHAMHKCSIYLVIPGSGVVLLAGLYMTIDRWDFGYLFITIGITVVILVNVMAQFLFSPGEVGAAELAERDIKAAGDGEVTLSDEYWAVSKRVASAGMVASLLILLALFFMVVKP